MIQSSTTPDPGYQWESDKPLYSIKMAFSVGLLCLENLPDTVSARVLDDMPNVKVIMCMLLGREG